MSEAVEKFLADMREIQSSGSATDETSYYPALRNFLSNVGEDLGPNVRCIVNIKNRGAGIPDGGLFTAPQLRARTKVAMTSRALPARGAIEAKPLADDAKRVAESDQVLRYLEKYGQVLVTNFRHFVLVGKGRTGKRKIVGDFEIAKSETAFWKAAANNKKTAEKLGIGLEAFLLRSMVRPAPITTPEDLAKEMAWHAQEALIRVEDAPLDALNNFKESLESALGITFEGKKSLHFFRSTIVQTLFYGIFSAWVIWSREKKSGGGPFDWRKADWTLHLPAIRSLFAEVATPRRIGRLHLEDVLDWAAEALERVDHKAFFKKFESKFAIQYFYEPFLENFDPDLRKELGVWYTPPEVVHYMVERIDTVLREELNIENGFADDDVYVLDPCAGTGSFLVEVLRRVEKTLKESGEEEFVASKLKKDAMERIFGFEIMPAPFVIAHLQVGLLLQTMGAPLDTKKDERAGIFLTNSLTGWEKPKGPQKKLSFIELQEEKEAAERVKRDTPILVVLGNPPYNAYAGTSTEEEHGIVDIYKAGLRNTWNIKKYNLDDLYIRFLRLAERQILEHTKKGIVCYISSYSYLSDPSFVILRERFYNNFDKAWIDSLNGDSRETGKLTPDGLPDPSIFSTERNREGIKLGTSIGLYVKKEVDDGKKQWIYRDFWGAKKRQELVDSLTVGDFHAEYREATPGPENRYNFRPINVAPHYYEWPSVDDIRMMEPSNGLMEKRRSALISIEKKPLQDRMRMYFDKKVPWDDLKQLDTGLTRNAAGYDAQKVRTKAFKQENYDEEKLIQYKIRPFDSQWAYYSGVSTLWNRNRPPLWAQHWRGNEFFITRRIGSKTPEGPPFYWSSHMFDDGLLSLHATAFPTRVKSEYATVDGERQRIRNNYNHRAIDYLESLGIKDGNDADTSNVLWLHALAIGFSPKYLQENMDGIKQDWPRIPLPSTKISLQDSAKLGRKISDLLDSPKVAGINKSPIRPEIRAIGKLKRADGKPLNPAEDMEVSSGWGRITESGVFPGRGKLELREYTDDEIQEMEKGGKQIGMTFDEITALLGEKTYDIYLNDGTFWRNIPEAVWNYHIGGYQVIKKWLSYREHAVVGRNLYTEEAQEVREMARRIAAILLMQIELNTNYRAVEHSALPWPPKATKSDG